MKLVKPTLLALLFTALVACDQENAMIDCFDSSNPENSSWFDEYTAQYAEDGPGYDYLQVGIYKFQTVYVPSTCCPNCLVIPLVLNCRGERIGTLGSGDDNIDPKDIKGLKVIWKSPNFQCQL